ncbi:MAG TPA: dolichyl-phosphate beta-glucosyltransferase [Thermodesulfovibrionales bacterium]|nr:dolichyl-phosphate beta-glucosyltransferase [Thermodesulfovibrionales bacterium]
MHQRKEFISIIIPAYNESSRIFPSLARLDEYLGMNFGGFELIVVNDGSSDSTEDVVSRAKKEMPSIRYLGYKKNRGKGYAIRQGVVNSTGDIILISDADLSTPIEELEKLLVPYDYGYPVVIGSRGLEGSNIVVRQTWWRESMGKAFNRIVRIFLLREFKDTQCGFKLFHGGIGRKLFRETIIDRFAYDVEVLYLATKAGYKVKEVPVTWLNSPASTVRPVKDSLRMARDLVRIRFQKNKLGTR